MTDSPLRPARPRTPDEVADLPPCPEVVLAAEERGIRDVIGRIL